MCCRKGEKRNPFNILSFIFFIKPFVLILIILVLWYRFLKEKEREGKSHYENAKLRRYKYYNMEFVAVQMWHSGVSQSCAECKKN